MALAYVGALATASGLLFGLDDDGNFSVKDGGLAMLMPGAGAVTRVAAGKAIAAGVKAGVPALSNPAVQNVLMKSGDQLAMNATMLAMQSPELAQLWQTDPDKFWQAVGATVGQNLAFALLPHTGKAGQTETAQPEAPPRGTSQTEPGLPDVGAATASDTDNEPPAASSETAPAPTPEALANLQSILRGNQGDALLKPSTTSNATNSSPGDARSIAVADDSNLSSGPSSRDATETSAETPSDGALPTNGGPVSDDGRTPVPSDPTPGYVPEPLPPGTPFNRVRSKVPLPGGGLNAKWLEASLGDLQAGLPGAPELVIVQSVKDLPQRQRGMMEADLEQGYRTSGIFDEGKAWLIADHLSSLDEARTTYLEEALGHAAMEPLVKPGEVDQLYDLIRRGAPQKAAEILRNYGHDVRTAPGRAAFVGEFVAKASEWYLEAPSLWRRIADVMRRLAYRVEWLRNLEPDQVLAAQMRGLARKGRARLAANVKLKNGPNRLSQGVSQPDNSTGPRFSRVRRPAGPDVDNHFATTSNTVPGDADSLRPLAAPKRSGGGSTGGRPQGLSDLAPGRVPENDGPVQTGGRTLAPSEPNLAEAPTQQTKQSNQTTDAGTTVPPASDFTSFRRDGSDFNLSEGGEPGIADQLADKLEAFKSGIKPGGPQMHIFGVAADLWDRAISMAQAVIRAGGSVGHAVDAALRHIQENHQGTFDEDSVRGFLNEKLGGLETAAEPSTPPLREPTKNDNYDNSNKTGTNENETSESHTALEGTASPDGGIAAAAAAHLERSGSVGEGDRPGTDEIDRQAQQLTDWAKSTGAIIPEKPFGQKLAQGAEHEVFLSPDGSRVIKRTYPGTFGVTPDVKGAQRAATPLFYLRRLELMNRVFGSDIRLEGIQMGDSPIIGKSGRQPSIVTSLRAYRPADRLRPHPSDSEISDFMRAEGFQPTPKSYFGWERPADGISVLDARPDNFIKTSEGVVPVDLVMDQAEPRALTPGEQQDLKTLQAMQKGTGLNPVQAARLAELQARSNLAGAPPPHQLDLTPTIERRLMPDGTPRDKWRMEQIRKALDLVPPRPPDETPDVIFLGGGPGAGKTTVKDQAIKEGQIRPERDATIAADDFKEGTHDVARAGAQGIPEYRALSDSGYPRAASIVHKESATMARVALRQAMKERRNAVYDATMSNYEPGARLIQEAKKAGYKTTMMGVAIDPDVAWQRSEIRRAKFGRSVSEGALRSSHAGFAQSFPRYLDLVDEATLWDNNGSEPRLILKKTSSGIEILDKKAYHKFVKGEHETK